MKVENTEDMVFVPLSLDPQWVLGFTDGEGCFCISFNLSKKHPCGVETRPSFSASQKSHSKAVLYAMIEFFGCGAVRYSKRDGTDKYEIRNLQEIRTKILPFFQKYKLLTQKSQDFALFVRVCDMMAQGKHLTKDGLIEIIGLASQMNIAGTRKNNPKDLIRIVEGF